MKSHMMTALAVGALTAFASAAVYTDSTGDNFDGNAHMDIASVQVTSTTTDITFAITLSGAPTGGNNWGKYFVGISTSAATGDAGSPVGNPWGRNITMADKMDAWIGGWADGSTGFQPWTYSAGWTQNGSGTPSIVGNTYSVTTSLASLGLSPGQTFQFDVYSGGGNGGDSANDALANPNQSTTGWGGPYSTPSSGTGAALSYTVVPEPASLALLGLGAVGMLRRRK